MLSEKQKRVLFGSRIESRPRYVRVPLQMKNGVRELSTDVNYRRLSEQYCRANEALRNSTAEPIAHIRMDASAIREWIGWYDRYCSAYRNLNSSRIIRRMQITGYRLLNVVCLKGGYEITTDAYVRGVDEACVILDMIVRTVLPSGRYSVALELNGSPQQQRALLSEIKASGMWRPSWRIELTALSRKMILRADRSEIVEALNLCLDLGASRVLSASFLASRLRLDFDLMETSEFRKRYEYLDLNVLLSGRRLRRVQRFGQISRL